jgi:hypothetical protein
MRNHTRAPLVDETPSMCWNTYGYALLEPVDESVALAKDACELVRSRRLWTEAKASSSSSTNTNHRDSEQSRIAGNVLQTSLEELQYDLRTRFHALVRKQIKTGICTLQQANRVTFACTKALVATKGNGAQPIHWDSLRWYEKDTDKWCVVTVLLYCAPCNSTSLPRFPASVFATDEPDAAGRRGRSAYLKPEFFHSVPVQPGHMLFFRHGVPHAGVASLDKQRIVLFDMFSQHMGKLSPENQYFEWSYIRDCYGKRSDEYKRSLLANLHHDPIGREPKAEERASLRKWLDLEAKEEEEEEGEQ